MKHVLEVLTWRLLVLLICILITHVPINKSVKYSQLTDLTYENAYCLVLILVVSDF